MEWSVVGPRPAQPRPSYTAAALALLFALQTFLPVPPEYPLYMVVIAIVGSAWCCWMGLRARAWIAWLFIPVAALWIASVLGSNWFNIMGPRFFLAHAALALLFATAAYTYAATEKR